MFAIDSSRRRGYGYPYPLSNRDYFASNSSIFVEISAYVGRVVAGGCIAILPSLSIMYTDGNDLIPYACAEARAASKKRGYFEPQFALNHLRSSMVAGLSLSWPLGVALMPIISTPLLVAT